MIGARRRREERPETREVSVSGGKGKREKSRCSSSSNCEGNAQPSSSSSLPVFLRKGWLGKILAPNLPYLFGKRLPKTNIRKQRKFNATDKSPIL